MFLSQQLAISQASLSLSVDWKVYVDSSGVLNTATLRADAEAFASAMSTANGSYAAYSAKTVTSGGLSCSLSEPLTLDTVFVHATAGSTIAQVATQLFKAPANKDTRNITVSSFNGTWWESVLASVVTARVRYALAGALSASNSAIARRVPALLARYNDLVVDLDKAFLPVRLYAADGGTIVYATSGFSWFDAAAVTTMDANAVKTAVKSAVTAGMSGATATAVGNAIDANLSTAVAALATGVDLAKAGSSVLSQAEMDALESLAGSMAGNAYLIFDSLGSSIRVFSVESFADAIQRIYSRLSDFTGQSYILDLDNSPRSMAELMFFLNGTSDAAFYDSLDAFYRRRELPSIPANVAVGLRNTLMSLHPLLIADVTIVGDRTVRVPVPGGTVDIVYPDLLGSGYKLAPSVNSAQSKAKLQQVHAFLTGVFKLFTRENGVSPAVLGQLGLVGVRRGYAFSV